MDNIIGKDGLTQSFIKGVLGNILKMKLKNIYAEINMKELRILNTVNPSTCLQIHV